MNVKEFEIQLALGTIKWRTDRVYDNLEDENITSRLMIKDDIHYYARTSRSKDILMYIVNHKRLSERLAWYVASNDHIPAEVMIRLLSRPVVRRWYLTTLNSKSCDIATRLTQMIIEGKLRVEVVSATKGKK